MTLIGAWDAVVTCFFMDTAKNIMEYMQVIHSTLKQNGTWINIGINKHSVSI
jgi:carnosine N-methyltransferase